MEQPPARRLPDKNSINREQLQTVAKRHFVRVLRTRHIVANCHTLQVILLTYLVLTYLLTYLLESLISVWRWPGKRNSEARNSQLENRWSCPSSRSLQPYEIVLPRCSLCTSNKRLSSRFQFSAELFGQRQQWRCRSIACLRWTRAVDQSAASYASLRNGHLVTSRTIGTTWLVKTT